MLKQTSMHKFFVFLAVKRCVKFRHLLFSIWQEN
uniref:Uncharacterized protein n=1 Tax=Arundo donax TaxID=35708 RepID=A0A0A9AVB2_ARUDO